MRSPPSPGTFGEDHVHVTGLVLKVHEDRPTRRLGVLTVCNHAGHGHPLAFDRQERTFARVTPRAFNTSRTSAMAVASVVRPIDHRSSATRSSSLVTGSGGATRPVTTPGSRSGRDCAAAPADQVRARRLAPKPSRAPPPPVTPDGAAARQRGEPGRCCRPGRARHDAFGHLGRRWNEHRRVPSAPPATLATLRERLPPGTCSRRGAAP